MKPLEISCPGRRMHAVAAVCAALIISTPCQSDVITLYPEADTLVDTWVPFPYQGGSGQLFAGYDSVLSPPHVTRSYLRFSLAGVSPVDQILSARLNLYADAVYVGGNIDLYRSGNDTWPELATNFDNQPGWSEPRLDTLFIVSTGMKSFELLRLSNWEPWMDIADGKVTLLIKAPELSGGPGVSFYSREGSISPALVITTRGRGDVLNPDWEDGDSSWLTSGDVSIVVDPQDPSNHVARLQTASPASIWQTIDAPNTVFGIGFDADFLTATGTFTITLGDTVLLSVTAPEGIPGGIDVPDRSLIGRNNLDLKFTLEGPDGVTSGLILDNIKLVTMPDPPLMIGPGETNGSLTLSFLAEDGFPSPDGGAYQVESSTDAVSWSDHGRQIGDLGITYEETVPATKEAQFFRLRIMPNQGGFDIEPPNWEFELPVLGENANTAMVPNWTSTGGAGVWNPPASVYPADMVEGENVAYVHNSHSLSQTLTNVLEAYRIYRLEARVGKRHDITFPTHTLPNLILRAGGVALVPHGEESPDPATGTFEWWAREFRIGKEHPQLGQPLEIILDGGTSGVVSQVNFDSVLIEVK